jgi:integrase
MSSNAKGARLWLKPARIGSDGRQREARWFIRDGDYLRSTGCGAGDREAAERALSDYIAAKYRPERINSRSPAAIPIADVLNIYAAEKATSHARPVETAQRIAALLGFFGDKTLAHVNGQSCRDYVTHRASQAAARRELEDLRAAINHHRREGLCSEVVEVTLPAKSLPRERWLTRSEAARLLWAAWRMTAPVPHGGKPRRTGQHVARFILVGLYTGTRASAICGASFRHASGRGFVDLGAGVFYRRAVGARETKKRQPPVKLPPRLLAHMRRWHRRGLCAEFVVEWEGKPVDRVSKAFAKAVTLAGLHDVSPHVLRHTCATWLMQRGVDVWEAAGFLGMTVEVLESHYGHHHPAFQSAAALAIGRRG